MNEDILEVVTNLILRDFHAYFYFKVAFKQTERIVISKLVVNLAETHG